MALLGRPSMSNVSAAEAILTQQPRSALWLSSTLVRRPFYHIVKVTLLNRSSSMRSGAPCVSLRKSGEAESPSWTALHPANLLTRPPGDFRYGFEIAGEAGAGHG